MNRYRCSGDDKNDLLTTFSRSWKEYKALPAPGKFTKHLNALPGPGKLCKAFKSLPGLGKPCKAFKRFARSWKAF